MAHCLPGAFSQVDLMQFWINFTGRMGLCHALSKEHEGTPLPFAPWCRKKTPDPADKAAPGKSTTPTPKRVRRSNRNRPNSLSLWDLVRGVGVIYENPSGTIGSENWSKPLWARLAAKLSREDLETKGSRKRSDVSGQEINERVRGLAVTCPATVSREQCTSWSNRVVLKGCLRLGFPANSNTHKCPKPIQHP